MFCGMFYGIFGKYKNTPRKKYIYLPAEKDFPFAFITTAIYGLMNYLLLKSFDPTWAHLSDKERRREKVTNSNKLTSYSI